MGKQLMTEFLIFWVNYPFNCCFLTSVILFGVFTQC